MSFDRVEPFLLVWIAVGSTQAILLLFFPAVARSLYVGWQGVWGLRVDPESPILSNGALRFFGVLTMALVIFGASMFMRGGQKRPRQDRQEWQQFEDFTRPSLPGR